MILDSLSIHLGLPKTATTSLQEVLSEQAGFLGKSPEILKSFRAYRLALIHEPAEFWIRRSSKSLRRNLMNIATEVSKSSGSIIFSWEAPLALELFLSEPSDVGLNQGENAVTKLLEMIKHCLPPAKQVNILLTVRRQPEWLASLYAQRSARIPMANQRDFEAYVLKLLDQEVLPMPLDLNRTLDELEAHLPKGNISIIPLEELQTPLASETFSRWLGADSTAKVSLSDLKNRNTRHVDSRNWRLREYNPRFSMDFRRPLLGTGVSEAKNHLVTLTEPLEELVINRVKESNRLLHKRTGFMLPGYF